MEQKQPIVHNSHLLKYREPFGAVATSATVKICIDISLSIAVKTVTLRLWQDGIGAQIINMTAPTLREDEAVYEASIPVGEKYGIIWYYFIIETAENILFYGNNKDNLGGEGSLYNHEPPSFQITIYQEGVTTPTWFKNAIIYQIFPDRFYRDNKLMLTDKKNRLLHGSWQSKPIYFKDVKTKDIIAYDFFGGNLAGIIAKLPYLKELGISVIYLNPIFEAQSNHRYDTGDYHKIDEWLGDLNTFKMLCQEANKVGIAIFLDGVFSHTGSDSKYFNKEGTYETLGAYQSKKSPYYSWYCFEDYPDKYQSWWGFDTLPNVNELDLQYQDFIINNNESVLKYWLAQGIKGWRLDVVDEIPDQFLKNFYKTLKQENAEAVLIGEVWEDASHKASYGKIREYLNGDELDSVMNYPFRRILIDFILGHSDAKLAQRLVLSLYENYPLENFYAMMNLVGSHDEVRIMTILGEAQINEFMPDTEIADYQLPLEQYKLAMQRLKLLATWQMTFPGVPSIYYGDEVGMQGYKDPHNRGSFIWGNEDKKLLEWYKQIIAVRNANPALRTGSFKILQAEDDIFIYSRVINQGIDVFGQPAENGIFIVIFNRSKSEKYELTLEVPEISVGIMEDVLTSCQYSVSFGQVNLIVEPLSVIILQDVTPQYQKKAGILMHPTSLPSAYGQGTMGRAAYEFIDFLEKAGQSLWQILPLNIPDNVGSPYQSVSAFAGNVNLLDFEELMTSQLLTPALLNQFKAEFSAAQSCNSLTVCRKYLKVAFTNFKGSTDYEEFCQQQSFWLNDFALFMALSEKFSFKSWDKWPTALRVRETVAISQATAELLDEINYYKFTQYLFQRQWLKLKRYANSKGIKIIGDLPIFVSHNSADVWANQKIFKLATDGSPLTVAGVPPDYFSETGQLWGNPHYDWKVLAKTDYQWWIERFKTLLNLVDMIRVDHFRGFEAYWEVPFGQKDAVKGRWVKAPGQELFAAIRAKFGDLHIIAEDLGNITDEVIALKQHFDFPGMNILQFSLMIDENEEIKFTCDHNSIIYTGTHDNNTISGWLSQDLPEAKKTQIIKYLRTKVRKNCAESDLLLEFAYGSRAKFAIIPLQDWLNLDSSARMNLPGSVEANWQWQVQADCLSADLALKIKELVQYYNRQ